MTSEDNNQSGIVEEGEQYDDHYDDEEDQEEEEENVVGFMDPSDSLLSGVQKLLTEQYSAEIYRVELELKEQQASLKDAIAAREQSGVDLYAAQQQLAKFQENLEDCHEKIANLHTLREEVEEDRDIINKQVESAQGELKEQTNKWHKSQADLDKLGETYRQVVQYNTEVESRIYVKRRGAYKAEEDMLKVEKEKKMQDFLIDSLNEQIKRNQERLSIYESQLQAQKSETTIALETLAEASAEMETIEFRKKQYLQQWKTSLIGMQRRDEALQATEAALRKQTEKVLSIQNEIEGYQQDIRNEQDNHLKLTNTQTKIEGEIKFLEAHIAELEEKKG